MISGGWNGQGRLRGGGRKGAGSCRRVEIGCSGARATLAFCSLGKGSGQSPFSRPEIRREEANGAARLLVD